MKIIYTSLWAGLHPLEPGWYNASIAEAKDIFRWWDGEFWSFPAYPSLNATQASYAASQKAPALEASLISWRSFKVEI